MAYRSESTRGAAKRTEHRENARDSYLFSDWYLILLSLWKKTTVNGVPGYKESQ